MPTNRHTSPKPGRNSPCPCGSGEKYKRCHGKLGHTSVGPEPIPAGLREAIERAKREAEAREMVRTRQQGFGKPIITVRQDGYRIVAVKNRLFWSAKWTFFTDFLLDYLKEALGREWGEKRRREGFDHPIFRWLTMLHQKVGMTEGRTEEGVRERGYMTSLFRLAYSLYLTAHHDQVPPSLVARLRSPRDETFRPAMYESTAAAAFAVAGFTIESAEILRTNRKTPEFWATSPTGVRYAVEAKCKLKWKGPCDVAARPFREELRAWIRDKLYAASLKGLSRPVYWLELSIPNVLSQEDYYAVREMTVEALREAETMTIKGEAPSPAYVFITNNTHMVNDLVEGTPYCAFLEGYRMPDMGDGREVTLEEAFETRDRHREIVRVFECLSEVQRVPMGFDGHPDELLGADGEPESNLAIGQQLRLDFPDGHVLEGVLTEITAENEVAWVVIQDTAGVQHLATMPLTGKEAEAARRHGAAAFGKPEGPNRNLGNDPVKLYDWLLDVFSRYSEEQLLRQIPKHRDVERIAALPLPAMKVRVAREMAKAAYMMSEAKRSERAQDAATDKWVPATSAGMTEKGG